MAKETILNRGGSSAIDCILPFAWNCAIGVSIQYLEISMTKKHQPKVTPECLMQFGFAYVAALSRRRGRRHSYWQQNLSYRRQVADNS
jgi:hypothetical protein